ncbi:MAG: hypothetical protein QXO32_02520 [Candidatus Bathyarchaeia archaeon]
MNGRLKTSRDVLVYPLGKRVLVVGCDSSGGVGPKPLDVVNVSGHVVGRYVARVALMEVLSTGAEPFCLVNTSCVEPKPLGEEVLRGIRDEVQEAGLDRIVFTGSSEKNLQVQQTATGVVILGLAEKEQLRIGVSRRGDLILALGRPCVGMEVVAHEDEVADVQDLRIMLEEDSIHEVIPVGSKGIIHEAETLAQDSCLDLKLETEPDVDLNKSAGPSTVLLATAQPSALRRLRKKFRKPMSIVGRLD